LLHGFHEALGSKWLVEDGLEAFLPGFDDGMSRVVAESCHEDDGNLGLHLAEAAIDFVAVEIGEPDID
jgi:hypothetical protein